MGLQIQLQNTPFHRVGTQRGKEIPIRRLVAVHMGVVQINLNGVLRSDGGDKCTCPYPRTHGGKQLRLHIGKFKNIVLIDQFTVDLEDDSDMVAVIVQLPSFFHFPKKRTAKVQVPLQGRNIRLFRQRLPVFTVITVFANKFLRHRYGQECLMMVAGNGYETDQR